MSEALTPLLSTADDVEVHGTQVTIVFTDVDAARAFAAAAEAVIVPSRGGIPRWQEEAEDMAWRCTMIARVLFDLEFPTENFLAHHNSRGACAYLWHNGELETALFWIGLADRDVTPEDRAAVDRLRRQRAFYTKTRPADLQLTLTLGTVELDD